MAVAIVVIVAQPKKKKKLNPSAFIIRINSRRKTIETVTFRFFFPRRNFVQLQFLPSIPSQEFLSWDGIKNLGGGEERKTTKVWKSRKEERKPQRDDPVEESRVDSSAWKKSVFIVFVRLFPPPPSLPFWDHRSFPIFGAFLGKRGL